jgi:tight adherence protein B
MNDIPTAWFVVGFLVMAAMMLLIAGIGMRWIESGRKRQLARILATPQREVVESEPALLLDEAASGAKRSLRSLAALPVAKSLEDRLRQAGMNSSPSALVARMAIGAMVGFTGGALLPVPGAGGAASVVLALVGGYLPMYLVNSKRAKRLRAFEEQFPEALDFISRSMRAGHAFSMSLEMLADESPNPLGEEFRMVYNEQNLGSPLDVALRNLTRRLPMLDVNFFVSAVLMQRETGGNLAEILAKLAYVIRERFRLRGQVRSASAHGRITSTILSIMPIVTLSLLMLIAPTYLGNFAADPLGRKLLIGAATGQLIGYYVMRRMVNIQV